MTTKASFLLTIPGHITLDDRDGLIEALREYARPFPSDRSVLIQWEAPDAWQLRGIVEETVYVVETMGLGIEFPSREVEAPGGIDTNLAIFQWWQEPQEFLG